MSQANERRDEDLLRAAMKQEGAAHDVDVVGLYATTQARVERGMVVGAHPSPVRRRRGWLAAAAIGVAASAAGVVIAMTPPTTGGGLAEDPASSTDGVESTFSCPVLRTTDFALDDDDSFLPELSPDGVPLGEAADAPMEEVVLRGDRAILRLGNADGSLASSTSFERVADGYQRLSVTKCSNEATASGSSAPLVDPGLPTPADLRAQDLAPSAVLVADRLTYDVSGLEKRITAYAYPCGVRVCLEAGSPDDTITTSTFPKTPAPRDLTTQLADPDDVVGIEPAQRFIGLHDREGTVREVSWSDASGIRTIVPAVQGGAWAGELYLVLVPSQTFDVLEVDGADEVSTYTTEDLRG